MSWALSVSRSIFFGAWPASVLVINIHVTSWNGIFDNFIFIIRRVHLIITIGRLHAASLPLIHSAFVLDGLLRRDEIARRILSFHVPRRWWTTTTFQSVFEMHKTTTSVQRNWVVTWVQSGWSVGEISYKYCRPFVYLPVCSSVTFIAGFVGCLSSFLERHQWKSSLECLLHSFAQISVPPVGLFLFFSNFTLTA